MPLEASLERPDKPELRLWLRLLSGTNLVGKLKFPATTNAMEAPS